MVHRTGLSEVAGLNRWLGRRPRSIIGNGGAALRTGRTRPTLKDVGLAARVDPSLVSRVLSGDPYVRVSEDTRVRILRAAQDIGYYPNALARGLSLAIAQSIGLLLPDLSNPIYAQVVIGAHEAAQRLGYVLVIGSMHDGEATEQAFAGLLHQGRVDGLIIASARVSDEVVAKLLSMPAPVVVANRRVVGALASVTGDDESAARLAVEHLVGLGHVHLAHVSGSEYAETSARRIAGFVRAVRANKVEGHIVAGGARAGEGYSAAQRLFEQHPEVTGVVVASLLSAIGVLHAAYDGGLVVPDDVSVVAIHDDPLADHLVPPLTTVGLPMRELGATAVELLDDMLNGGAPKHVVIARSPTLVSRASTGRARDGRKRGFRIVPPGVRGGV